MDSATGTITTSLGEVEGFHDHALPGKRRIAMHQHGQHLLVALGTATLLARAHTTLNDWIDDFKVRGVKRERQMHWAATRGKVT